LLGVFWLLSCFRIMCRWIVYFGNEVTVSDAIGTYGHGLVEVANAPVYAPGLSKEQLLDEDKSCNYDENGDGFGIGFYPSDKGLQFPAVLRDCKPIWHSNNLGPIAGGVKSSLVFGHVRKTCNYGSIAEQNCHPFRYGVYIFMHNGFVYKFHKVRSLILELISEFFDSVSKDHDIEEEIQGTTDSEALFFLILAVIAKKKNSLDFTKPTCTTKELKNCMVEGINLVLKLVHDKLGEIGDGSSMNLALSDGTKVIVTRFRNSRIQPPSLYFTLRQKDAKKLRNSVLSLDDEKTGVYKIASDERINTQRISLTFGFSEQLLPTVVMIASEPVDREEEAFWELIPSNTIISIKRLESGGLEVRSELMNIPMSLYMTPDNRIFK